jgi:hypothetical protein
MDEIERFRARLAAAGALVPEGILGLVAAQFVPVLDSLDVLLALDLGGVEPFVPSQQLVRDAAE